MNWTFSDPDSDTQGAKQVQVSPNSSFTTITFDSGKVSNDIPAYSIPATGSGLQFNNTYYWRVKVWDPAGLSSSWITSSQTLNTPPNEYPTPAFTANPPRPAKNQSTLFADDSTGATDIAKWSWTFQDANPSNYVTTNPSKKNPIAIFTSEGIKLVNLTVWDANNNSCSITKTINVGIFAPVWQEIVPW